MLYHDDVYTDHIEETEEKSYKRRAKPCPLLNIVIDLMEIVVVTASITMFKSAKLIAVFPWHGFQTGWEFVVK